MARQVWTTSLLVLIRPLGLTKYDYAATLAASLAWLGLSQGDAVGASVFDEEIRTNVPPRTNRSHLNSLIAGFRKTSPANTTPIFMLSCEILQRIYRGED